MLVEPRWPGRRFSARLIALGSLWALAYPAAAQVPVIHEGKPALRFDSKGGWETYLDYMERDGEVALRFPVAHYHSFGTCEGFLYVTRDRVTYDPVYSPQNRGDALSVTREKIIKTEGGGGIIHRMIIVLPERTLSFVTLSQKGTRRRHEIGEGGKQVSKFFVRSIMNFEDAVQAFQHLTATLRTAQARAKGEELKEGQTPEEVVRLLGEPDEKITVNQSTVYLYPRFRVVFENRKLVRKEPR